MRRRCGTSSIPIASRSLHRRFIEAGADIVLTNTFGGNRHRLKLHNAQDRVREINIAAAKNARAEADAVGRPVYVGGSIGPTGEIFEPIGSLSHEDGVAAFAEQATALKEGGVDVLWIETMSSEEELRAAVEGAADGRASDRHHHELRHQWPHHDGHHAAGLRRARRHRSAPSRWRSAPIAASAHRNSSRPSSASPRRGPMPMSSPRAIAASRNMSTATSTIPARPSSWPTMRASRSMPVRKIIGGCCGTSPEHLAAMRQSLETYSKGERPSVEPIEARLGAVSELAKGFDAAAAGAARRERRRARD